MFERRAATVRIAGQRRPCLAHFFFCKLATDKQNRTVCLPDPVHPQTHQRTSSSCPSYPVHSSSPVRIHPTLLNHKRFTSSDRQLLQYMLPTLDPAVQIHLERDELHSRLPAPPQTSHRFRRHKRQAIRSLPVQTCDKFMALKARLHLSPHDSC